MNGVGVLTVEYKGGPLDGLEVEVPADRHQWARYTDPTSGVKHYYELVWQDDGYRYVYRPEAKP